MREPKSSTEPTEQGNPFIAFVLRIGFKNSYTESGSYWNSVH